MRQALEPLLKGLSMVSTGGLLWWVALQLGTASEARPNGIISLFYALSCASAGFAALILICAGLREFYS